MKSLNMLFILAFAMLLSSCSNSNSLKGSLDTHFTSLTGCPDAEISWVDMLMIDDIKYEHHYSDAPDEKLPITFEKGRELGQVTYHMAGNACSDHKAQNGDATYLEVGTTIYEIKGYPTALIVAANDVVYVVGRNQKAKTAGELYPMDKLVKDIHIQSTEDGKRMHTFSQSSKDKFLTEFYQLSLGDLYSLNAEGKLEGTRIFLEIELSNGFSFSQLYWSDSNTFHNGAIGNDEIEEVINYELSNLNN